MTNDTQYRETIRNMYYENIIKLSDFHYDEMITQAMGQLKDIIDSTVVGIYKYDEWKKTYTRNHNPVSDDERGLPLHLESIPIHTIGTQPCSDKTSIWKGNIFRDEQRDLTSYVLRLNPKDQTHYFLIILMNELSRHSNETLAVIKNETENFMKIVDDFYMMKMNHEHSIFMKEFSARVNLTNIQAVIRQIVHELQSYYSDFSHQFYLSQDFETDESLPVKLIEFSDRHTDSLLKKAFITGEFQIKIEKEDREQYFIYAPLVGNQAVYGVIQIKTFFLIDFLDIILIFLSQFVQIAGRAMENATLYKSSTNLVSDLKFINEVTHELNGNHKLSDLLKVIKTKIVAVSDASQVGFIYYGDHTEEEFQILPESTKFFKSKEGEDFSKELYKRIKKKPESTFSGNFTRQYSWIPYESVMILPMNEAGNIYGFTIIMHEEPFYFTFEKYKLMQSLIQHSTLALINTILKDKLETAVITDYLTKLYARNYLDEMITMHMKLDEKGTLILFDIDDFKMINDKYGHSIGDQVLKQVAKIIKQNIRSDDVPARWGGEEFAIYLPHVDLNEGVSIADRIREQIKKSTDPNITISCGLSSWENSKTNSVSEMFARADKALYHAKEMGKNRIVKEMCENE